MSFRNREKVLALLISGTILLCLIVVVKTASGQNTEPHNITPDNTYLIVSISIYKPPPCNNSPWTTFDPATGVTNYSDAFNLETIVEICNNQCRGVDHFVRFTTWHEKLEDGHQTWKTYSTGLTPELDDRVYDKDLTYREVYDGLETIAKSLEKRIDELWFVGDASGEVCETCGNDTPVPWWIGFVAIGTASVIFRRIKRNKKEH